MSKIKITDQTNTTKLSAEQMEQVKGGPVFMKLDDIKGESQDSRSTTTRVFTSVQGPYQNR